VTPTQWLEAYRQAWQQRDADAAAALFTENATYTEQPYQAAFEGRQGVHDYWARVTATQSEVEMQFGKPLSNGNRTAVEWWTTLENGGHAITLAGSFMLEFDDSGLCSCLREYWHFAEGTQQPWSGWGS
jgi:predicted SnoaL-like aldol condensation-catalyzing enzyme